MNGFIVKTIAISVFFLSTTTHAANVANHKVEYHAAGCMACHQGEMVQPIKPVKKKTYKRTLTS